MKKITCRCIIGEIGRAVEWQEELTVISEASDDELMDDCRLELQDIIDDFNEAEERRKTHGLNGQPLRDLRSFEIIKTEKV